MSKGNKEIDLWKQVRARDWFDDWDESCDDDCTGNYVQEDFITCPFYIWYDFFTNLCTAEEMASGELKESLSELVKVAKELQRHKIEGYLELVRW